MDNPDIEQVRKAVINLGAVIGPALRSLDVTYRQAVESIGQSFMPLVRAIEASNSEALLAPFPPKIRHNILRKLERERKKRTQ